MKLKKMLCCLLAVVMVISVAVNVVACEKKGETVTVSWYDGRQELKTETVAKGSKAQEWQPSKNGYDFFGWYEDAAFGNPFDFDKELQEDTDIYARWRSSNPTEDNRMWYVIGSVPGENWDFLTEKNDEGVWVKSSRGQEASNQKYFFTNEGNNVFSVTLTLRPNCKFQFVTNLVDKTTWEGDEGKGRMGLGNIKGFEYASGVNPEADGGLDGYHDIEDKMYGEVKDDKGNVVFNGGQGYDVATYCWNIYPAVGSDGVYKFTFKSYPGEEAINVVEWELLEKLDPLESFFDMYLTGSYHNNPDDVNPSTNTGPADVWDDDPEADWCIHFTKTEGTTLHKAFITVTSDMYPSWSKDENPDKVPAVAFKVKNLIDGKDYGCGGSSGVPGTVNCWITEGTWCISYDEATNIVSWEKCDYFVVGTFKAGERYYDFTVADEIVTPKMTSADGATYEASVNVPPVNNTEVYSWLNDNYTEYGDSAVFALKVAFGCKLGIKEMYGVGDEGEENLYFGEAGTYTVQFNVETEAVTCVKTSSDYKELKTAMVTYYEMDNGTPVQLKQEELLTGQTADYKPTGRLLYIFDGWYSDENCTQKFNTTVSQDTNLYCKFIEGTELDSRDFWVVGTGVSEGTLGKNKANFTDKRAGLKLTKATDADAEGRTVYTIDMTLYNGDTFQLITDFSWQSGAHYGIAELRDETGAFQGSGVGNIFLKTGFDGKYRFTLHTNPYNTTDSYIECELLEKVTPIDTYRMYVIGNIEATGWNNWNTNRNYLLAMTKEADGLTWSVIAHFTGGDIFKVYNDMNGGFFPDGTDDQLTIGPKNENGDFIRDENNVIAGSGWYKISWNQDQRDVKVELVNNPDPSTVTDKSVVYLIGNFEGNNHNDRWATNSTDAMLAMTRDECGYTWSITTHFAAGDQLKVYLYRSSSNGTWVPDGKNGTDTKIEEAGTYTITWNHFTNKITVTKVDDATSA